MNSAPAPQRQKGDPRPKLKNVGMYVVEALDVKYHDTRKLGTIFLIPNVVVTGPEVQGFRHDVCYTPDSIRPNNSDYSIEELRDREVGKIQRAIAAVAGWEDSARHNVNQEYSLRATVYPRPANQPNVKSPLAGQKFCIEVCLSTNGKPYPTLYPYTAERAAKALEDQKKWEVEEAAKAAAATAKAPALPTATTPAVPVKAPVFPPAPWQIHPDNDDYVFIEATGQFKTVVELKAELGIA